MRGKLICSNDTMQFQRITPADAGKTDKLSYSKLKDRDHPRGCGENSSASSSLIPHQGSPPRMRGKQIRFYCKLTDNRITPADAGKTIFRQSFRHRIRDHPRGCGENFVPIYRLTAFQGSPPRMRGKQNLLTATYSENRITPADAGKT